MINTRKLDFIQGLRGIAALMVVLAHTRINFVGIAGRERVIDLLFWGGGGVDLFFVISGFIMVHATRSADGSLAYVKKFVIKRLAKIWPPYVILSVVWVFVGRGGFSYFDSDLHYFVRSMFFQPIDASNPMYLGSAMTTLPVGWTLNYEIYFYCVFAVSMLFGRLRWWVLSIVMVGILVVIPATHGMFTLDPLQASSFRSAYLSMMINPIIWDFLAGVLIGCLYYSETRCRNITIIYAALAGCMAIYLWSWWHNLRPADGIAGWGAYSAFIVACLAMLSKERDVWMPSCIVFVGNVSYTLYLVQDSVLAIVRYAVIRWGYSAWIGTFTHVTIATCSCIAAAAVISPLLERRLHDSIVRCILRPQNS